MKKVAPMHTAVKKSRKGIRRPPRSDKAPRIGETSALIPTLTAIATDSSRLPSRSPNRSSLIKYSPIAPETTANEKIVFAKSYNAQATGTIVRPLGVSPARPPCGTGDAGSRDGAAFVTGR